MKRTLFGLGLALALGGCAELSVVTGTSVTPEQAYIAANAFDTLEATATTYLNLPTCTTGGSALCRTAAGVNAIVPAIRVGRTARNNLEAAVTAAGGAPVSVSLYTALTAQSSTLQALIATYNIGAAK